LPDLSTEERLTDPAQESVLKAAFKRSRFAEQVPLYVERPFLLWIDGIVVGGRIDAVFGEHEGSWGSNSICTRWRAWRFGGKHHESSP
jgi:DNA helicase-2/ATP-dependent DNA helicase PcrA